MHKPTIAKQSIHTAEHYTWGNHCDGWHFFKSEALSVIRERMPPGTAEQLHYHENAQQVFYILSGTATFEANGQLQVLSAGEGIHIPPKALHRISNRHGNELEFLLTSQPGVQNDRVEIIDYNEALREPIKTLNYEWLEKYFYVEPSDIVSLSDPEKEIIGKGGFIYYAKWNNEIVGTVSLLRESDEVFELGKMAVTEKAQGHYIGNALIEHCFHVARQKGIKNLVLYSNTQLGAAIHLYRKYGFAEVPCESGHYERADIKMEAGV